MSLRQLAIGSASMGSVGVLRMLMQLFIVPALARYLTPADYGLVAIAMPFVLFGMMFSDAGMSSSLIRTTSRNAAEWSTSFWLIMMLGAGLTVGLSLVGYLVSLFLGEPKLFPIIVALSLIILLQSIATVPGAAIQQSHRFSTLAAIEIVSMAASLTGTYMAATHGWGAWSLVAQQVIQYTTKFVLTLILSPFRPHLVFRLGEITSHLTFGRDMIGNNFVSFLRQSLTNTITGKALGTAAVGVYTMAFLFSDLPNRLISGPIQLVVYPRMARLADDPQAIRRLFLFLSRIISILVVPVIGMLAAAHDPVFRIFLTAKWHQSGFIFLLMAPMATVQTVTALRGTIAMAMAKTDLILRQAWEVGVLSIAILLVSVHFGLEGVVIGANIVTFLYTPRALNQIFRLIDLPMRDFLAAVALPFGFTGIGISAYIVLAHIIGPSDWEAFAIAFILGIAVLLGAILSQFAVIRHEVKEVKAMLDDHHEPVAAATPA